MLGQLLGVAQQRLGIGLVLGPVGAARPGAGDRPDHHRAVAQPDQDLGARADQGEAVEIQIEQERRRVEPAQRPIQRQGRQIEGQAEALGGHHLEDVARPDVGLRLLDHGVVLGAGHVRDRCRQRRAARRLGPVRQATIEVGDHIRQPLAGEVVGGPGPQLGRRPDRRHQHHPILDIVEDRHHGRPDQHRVRDAELIRIGIRQALHQPDHVVAEIAEQPGRHRRQRRRQVDPAFGDQGAQRGERAVGAGLEAAQIMARLAIDLDPVAKAAPDQIGLHADRRVAAAHRPAFDRFQEEAVGPAFGQLQHRGDRGLEIRDQGGPDHLRSPGGISLGEARELGAGLHQ